MTRKKAPPWMHPNAEFHMYVGFCVTAWAKVEDQLFALCTDSLGTSKKRSSIVYYKTPSLESRISLVDELVETVLPARPKDARTDHPDVTTWKKILADVKRLLADRRQIAHSPVSVKHDITSIDPKTAGAGISGEFRDVMPSLELDFSMGERLRGKIKKRPPLRVDDLSIHGVAVQSAANAIKQFREVVLRPHLK